MKAAVITRYGPADVLQVIGAEKPVPKDDEILIKVRVGVVSPADGNFRQGKPFIVRLMYGLRKPRNGIPGVELAGDVEAVGKQVTSFKVGDRVFGISPDKFGAQAEYIALAEKKPIVTMSASMTYEDAVGICDGATTALTFLRDIARIQRGQKILINGASGAVGIYAVQLAKHFGAEVTGVCSGANVQRVLEYGAAKVIDYTKDDFTQNGQIYDIIFDAVARSSFARCKRALAPKGVYMTTAPTLAIVRQMILNPLRGGKKAKFAAAGLMLKKADLETLKDLFEAGRLRAVIDRFYSLEQIAEAHRYVETGHKKGNVVITVT